MSDNPRHVVRYTSCPDCRCGSLGVQRNGRMVRHSIGFGSVEKVGPGTRRPRWRTIICTGSGKKVCMTLGGHTQEPSEAAQRAAWKAFDNAWPWEVTREVGECLRHAVRAAYAIDFPSGDPSLGGRKEP